MFFKNSQTIKNYDLIIVGNSLAAVISAGTAAKNGKAVALVTQSELLFGEISEGLLGFVKNNSPLYDLLLELGANPTKVGDEYHIPSGMASKIALKYLKENKVNVFLKAAPIGLLTKEEAVCGIAVATKFGAYVIKGGFLADFSNRKFYEEEEITEKEYLYALQMGGVNLKEVFLPFNFDFELENAYNITLHGDCRSEDTCILTFKTSENSVFKLIETANKLSQFLIKNNTEFSGGGVLKYSLRPILTNTHYNTPKKNLLVFKTGDFLSSDNYYNALVFANDLIHKFTEKSNVIEPDTLKTTFGEFNLNSLYTGEELDEFLGAEVLKINFPTSNIPEINTQLFIAGLGAGGSAAMKGALDMGAEVIGAEALPVPAGTRGQGMVSAFWHGYQNGFATENLQKIKAFSKENLGKSAPPYTAEIAYDINYTKGATVFYESLVFAAIKDENGTCGAVLATPDGVIKINANKLIDATGDADLAMLSGTEYMPNGDPRDRVTQGYSVWGDEKVGTVFADSLYKSDEDSISTENYSEFLRGIYTAHLKQSDLGFSALLTVRESRRIKGKYTLNMKDILGGRLFDDTISVSLCKYDAHGTGSSPAYYTMLFNALRSKEIPDVITRIPLRALLPEKDGGLMVISKSISATRDAGCLIRMNPDIQNTGYAAGLIAANAARNNTDFETAYTDEIKNELILKKILPDYYNTAYAITVAELIEKIKSGDIWARSVATVRSEMIKDFEAAYDGDENLAMVLAALGSKLPFEKMLGELKTMVEAYKSEKSFSADNATLIDGTKHTKPSPDKIKSHAVILSRLAAENAAKKSEFLPILCEAIKVMDAGGGYGDPTRGIYQNSKVSNRVVPNFKAIMGLCIAAETVADSLLAEPLMELSKKQNIRLEDGDEIHSVQLYLRIIAAAARCGDNGAKEELERFTKSKRLFFREFAKSELNALSSAETDVLPAVVGEFWV